MHRLYPVTPPQSLGVAEIGMVVTVGLVISELCLAGLRELKRMWKHTWEKQVLRSKSVY